MRIFIALDLPEEVKKEIIRIQELLPEFKGKKVEQENLHLTLKFLGEVSEETLNQIKERLSKIKLNKLHVRLGEIGVFTPKSVKIVWIKLLNTEKLQEEIDRVLVPLFPKENRFMSHITIARVKGISERKTFLEKIKSLKPKWLEFELSNFSLKNSVLSHDKPVYSELESYSLD